MRRFGWLVFLAACVGETGDTDTADTSDTSDSADTSDSGDTDEGPAGEAHGTVLDGDGAPVVGAKVNLCKLVCTTVETDAAGAFDFAPLGVGDYSFHVVPPTSAPDLAEPLVPFAIEEAADPAIPVVLPTLGAAVSLPGTATELEVAPGLLLTLKSGDLEITFEDPPTAVRGALVAADDRLPIDVAGTIVAVWYLDPYEANAEEAGGIPLRVRNDFGLADGTYEIWRASYWDYAFVKVGDFAASGGYLTNASARLPELTTVVLVDPD